MKKLTLVFSVFIILSVSIFVINQTAQVVMLANTIGPMFGRIVLWTLIAVYGSILITSLWMILRLPKAMQDPPIDENSAEYAVYLKQLGRRLKTNSRLGNATAPLKNTRKTERRWRAAFRVPSMFGGPATEPFALLTDRASIEAAFSMLDDDANAIIKTTASSLFVSTAISQNGRLDTLMVLAAQTRMIWQLAHIYNQRPALSEMASLYAHVGTALFLASELEDLDISHQIEPVVKAAIGSSLAGLVPGISSLATIVTHSILNGTANAYLTLRVGVITQTYSRPVTAVDQKRLKRKASMAAAALLGSIVSESSSKVVKIILAAAKDTGTTAMQTATSGIRQIGAQVGAKLNPFAHSTNRDR